MRLQPIGFNRIRLNTFGYKWHPLENSITIEYIGIQPNTIGYHFIDMYTLEFIRTQLSTIKCHFPKVARTCGLKVQKRDIGTELTLDRCSTLMRLGFDPKYSGGVGATSPNRLRAFLHSMHGTLQEQGILKLLWECSLFRAQSDAHQIVLGFDFESDRRSIWFCDWLTITICVCRVSRCFHLRPNEMNPVSMRNPPLPISNNWFIPINVFLHFCRGGKASLVWPTYQKITSLHAQHGLLIILSTTSLICLLSSQGNPIKPFF